MHIALLGAPRTGKTSLFLQISQRLQALGLTDVTVSDAPAPDLQPTSIHLLMGLDLPLSVSSTDATEQAVIDARLRSLLNDARAPYQVVYGQGEERLRNALYAIARQCPEHAELLRSEPPVRWQGVCESCGDAVCEHRLFSRLVKQA